MCPMLIDIAVQMFRYLLRSSVPILVKIGQNLWPINVFFVLDFFLKSNRAKLVLNCVELCLRKETNGISFLKMGHTVQYSNSEFTYLLTSQDGLDS